MADLAAIHADPLGLLVAFGAGMLSFLSPCVLPLVPAYLSMVSGPDGGRADAPSAATRRDRRPRCGASRGRSRRAAAPNRVAAGAGSPADAVAIAVVGAEASPAQRRWAPMRRRCESSAAGCCRGILAFIAGFTVVFTILGASASSIGRLFLTHQHTLEVVSGVLIVVFGAGAGGDGRRRHPADGAGRRDGASSSARRCSAPGPRRSWAWPSPSPGRRASARCSGASWPWPPAPAARPRRGRPAAAPTRSASACRSCSAAWPSAG